jgi:hypothetical protein
MSATRKKFAFKHLIALVIIVGTAVVSVVNFGKAIADIDRFVRWCCGIPNPPAQTWREEKSRALNVVNRLAERGLNSPDGYYTNFSRPAFSIQNSLTIQQKRLTEEQKAKGRTLTREEEFRLQQLRIEAVKDQAVFSAWASSWLTNYIQLSSDLAEAQEALQNLERHSDFPPAKRKQHEYYLRFIQKMIRTCDLAIAVMSRSDNRNVSELLEDSKTNSPPPIGGQKVIQALQEYLTLL